MVGLETALVGAAVSAGAAAFSYKRGSLSKSGAVAAFGVGTSIFAAGGVPWFAVLLVFFVTASGLGKVGSVRKAATKREFSKSDTRDALQVLANGGLAAGAALAFGVSPRPLFAAAFLGALAAANGDTWATELGTLARGKPRSVLTFKPVPTGTSGAVSIAGTLATAAGASLLGVVAALGAPAFHTTATVCVLSASVGGFVGAFADSVLGASVQSRFHCPACDVTTEGELHHCGTPTTHAGGLRLLGNDGVNAVATAIGALTAMAVSRLL